MVFLIYKILTILLLMSEYKTIINYRGPVEFQTTRVLLEKVKNDLDALDVRKVLKKRVYNIMVECLENILKYKPKPGDSDIDPYIKLEKGDDRFLITAGNVILNEEIGPLKQKLKKISARDKEGLQAMYEDQINKEELAINNSAGLGLITVAIKSDGNINYNFRSIDEFLSIFEIQAIIQIVQ
jgi:hypothetical protein